MTYFSQSHLRTFRSRGTEGVMARISAAERRRLLVEAAFRVTAREGLQAATTRAVCEEAGMSQSVFHYCFRTKKEMLQGLVTVTVQDLVDVAVKGVEAAAAGQFGPRGTGDPSKVIGIVLNALWEEARARPERHLALYEVTAFVLRDPELAELAGWQYRMYFEQMEALLATLEGAAGIEWTTPRPVVARMLVSAFDGLVLGWLTDRDDAAVEASLAGYASAFAQLASAPSGR